MSATKIIISPSSAVGGLESAPSKSYSHRAIICAALANGKSVVSNALFSADTAATIAACTALGARVLAQTRDSITIEGVGGKPVAQRDMVDCNESGSTLRFMIPIAALADKKIIFTGAEGLRKRPVGDLLDALKQLGAECGYVNNDGALPVQVNGTNNGLAGGMARIRGDVSSQFISGLLFALPLAKTDSVVQITTAVESRDYIAVTIDVLKKFGVEIDYSPGFDLFKIRGNQVYSACDYKVEGDYSSAAFPLAAGVLSGKVVVKNLSSDSMQGDKRIVDVIKSMGGNVSFEGNGVVAEKSVLRSCEVDARNIPDLAPIIAVLASQAQGVTRINNVERLKLKESDRLGGTVDLVNGLGGKAWTDGKTLFVEGKTKLRGGAPKTLNDHRLVMSSAVVGLICETSVELNEPGAVFKSYPHFFEDFKKLGASVREE
ncbi:3-phosphoshikimate 1-carboxyvinyltransferase [Candidatus Micrarchaeota archaeon]|nr:3-phosphoshikimate 1-carboxyvinyltransferase [Candidatus Micrarchaeota archaeon]